MLYYELLKPGETMNGERYRTRLILLKRAIAEKRPEYATRHEFVPVDPVRPHWNTVHIRTGYQKLAGFILGRQAGAVLLGWNPKIARKMRKSHSFRWAIL